MTTSTSSRSGSPSDDEQLSLKLKEFKVFPFFQTSLQELEQQRPLLEKQVTAAQNLKNKINNPDTRTAITERSES